MKKYINTALVYAVLAMCAGVFFREFTKLNGFTGETMLGFAHPHLFALGTCVFLLAALCLCADRKICPKSRSRGFISSTISGLSAPAR